MTVSLAVFEALGPRYPSLYILYRRLELDVGRGSLGHVNGAIAKALGWTRGMVWKRMRVLERRACYVADRPEVGLA